MDKQRQEAMRKLATEKFPLAWSEREHDLALAAYDAGRADFALQYSGWVEIKSEDDLPTEDVTMPVLVRWPNGKLEVYSFAWNSEPPSGWEPPTHWMPIPPAPFVQEGE